MMPLINHSAMKYAPLDPRKEMAGRGTIFNLLGPIN